MQPSKYFQTVCCLTTVFCCAVHGVAQDDAAQARMRRMGQFVSLTSPINEIQVARVGNLAVELQAQAEREDKEAVLVLEIPAGSSTFGQVSDMARRLTRADISRVRTVAWVPETVDGYHAILALACHDIVMDPDAALGDIGRGATVPDEEQQFILSIVKRRRNSRVSLGVVHSMMDPSLELLRVRMEGATGLEEQRFLTPPELKIMRDRNTVISDTQTINDIGAPGLFNASDAQRSGFLVAKTVKSRRDVAALYDLPNSALREQFGGDSDVKAQLIRINEAITPLTEEFILRQIRTSVSKGANLLIFDIESPGGYLTSSVSIANAIAELNSSKVTTVAWIENQALSGAAIIAFGADRIIMRPDARIGDAGVIQETEAGGAFERAPEKIKSDFLVTVQNLAERKNRPVALLQAMVDKDLTVYQATNKETGRVTYMTELEIQDSNEEWVKGPVVPESRDDVLLTVNGQRAHDLTLADAPCENFDALRLRLGVPENNPLKPQARTWVDTLVWVLRTQIAGFGLITLAILCIYMELHLPSGFFGILSIVFFSLFFWSRYLGETAGSLELIMFVLGIGLLALEIFVVPGFGVFGVSGILLMAGSLVMASHTFAGMSAGERFNESMSSLGSLAGALCTVIVVAMILNRFLPSMPFINKLILTPPGYADVDENAPQLNPTILSSAGTSGPVSTGDVGVAASTLRPSGKANIGDHFLDVVSDGGYIDHGTEIEVIRIAGNRIIVRPHEPGGDEDDDAETA
ncbi:SDH family Clp fold serine proteinase [Fuerstiella marisgermanici]|uniref:Signal peptide peptidase SppA, 36K type n=1 Tax=Fuerstiella marisgermanici TaxID=1891926 RepID=A0A1P8WET2_9PLAN|nr:NfeD family protein [Fuerstiella marisgermanici]APZ92559.1 signal peptide peptidase SppA, 36K type [Fuerstiella marisgermanici]